MNDSVNEMDKQGGAIKKACVLRAWKGGQQALQKFYITNLGHDRVLLVGYPWLNLKVFNRAVDWATGTLKGGVRLETIPIAWQRWKKARQHMGIARTNCKVSHAAALGTRRIGAPVTPI